MKHAMWDLHDHVVLTSHPRIANKAPAIHWGAASAHERGPIIATFADTKMRNAIGAHSGSYTVYRALAEAAGSLKHNHRPDLTNTSPVVDIAPNPAWHDPTRIVSMDPYGARIQQDFAHLLEKDIDIRPTIAITRASIQMPELMDAIRKGIIPVDGTVVKSTGDVVVTKVAMEPVWYLPGIAARLGIDEGDLRRNLFQRTGGMYPELITRPDLKVMLPPIGGATAYIFGDPQGFSDPKKPLAVRMHDECNGSDVFGSDICTCRPYLLYGIERAILSAQKGGAGLVVYYRKEGRSLGEVTKFLVYNARKRQPGGDTAATYFTRTECVAGVQDVRFQEFMPDIFTWFGIQHIHELVSMSDMKHGALIKAGITVGKRTTIPADRIPHDASVEMEAKKAAGYFSDDKTDLDLTHVKGRSIHEY